MEYVNLGRTGLQVSRVCLGTNMFGAGYVDDDRALSVIDEAYDQGINFIDTADAYHSGLSEGVVGRAVKGRRHDWGYAQWARPLVRLILDGNMGVADYQCRQILRDRYCRLAPLFPVGTVIESDEIDRIPELLAFAANVDLDPTIDWLDRNW